MANIQEERLQAYLDAEKKTLESQEYQDGSMKNRRASLDQIGQGINTLLAIGVGTPTTGRSRRVILRD